VENRIVALKFIEDYKDSNSPTLQTIMDYINVDDIVSLEQYRYSDSLEAKQKKNEMYLKSMHTFFDATGNYAFCTTSDGKHYEIMLDQVGKEFKEKYLKVVEI